jgi:hypothetical protein
MQNAAAPPATMLSTTADVMKPIRVSRFNPSAANGNTGKNAQLLPTSSPRSLVGMLAGYPACAIAQ